MIRVRLKFRHQVINAGWSDSYWLNTNDMSVAYSRAFDLRRLLLDLVGRNTGIEGFVLTRRPILAGEAGADRASYPAKFKFTPPGTALYVNPGGMDTSDFPTNCVVFNPLGQIGSNVKSFWFLNGVPDNLIAPSGEINDTPEWRTRRNAFRNFCTDTNNKVALVSRDPATPQFQISAFDAITGVVTTTAAHGYVRNDMVSIHAYPAGQRYPNKRWRINDVPNATSFRLRGWDPPASFLGGVSVGAPYVKKVVYVTRDVDSFGDEFSSKRNVGRPSRRLTGRRTTRK